MPPGAPRFKTFPQQPGVKQLRWHIQHPPSGALTIHEFLADFRRLHASVEREGSAA